MEISRYGSASVITARLTPREQAVLQGICAARCTKQIAAEAGMPESAVKHAVHAMLAALGLRSRVGLLMWGLAHPDALSVGSCVIGVHADGCRCQACRRAA